MKIKWSLVLMILFNSGMLFSQLAINDDGRTPDASAILDFATTEKCFLIPRMTQSQTGRGTSGIKA